MMEVSAGESGASEGFVVEWISRYANDNLGG